MSQVCEAKVVLLGSTSVGKTCISTRATSDFFDPKQLSTVGAAFTSKVITNEDGKVTLRIWDTSGQERFRSLTPLYFHNSDVALIVFSLTDPDTLKDVSYWIEELQKNTEKMPLLYLVGNKSDLVDERRVTIDQANETAEKYGMTYFDTSALSGQGVNELFNDIACSILKNNLETDHSKISPSVTLKNQQNNKKKECC